MGYPALGTLATIALEAAHAERPDGDFNASRSAVAKGDYPKVFQQVKDTIGAPRLLQILQSEMRSERSGKIYEFIASWPVPVYLTTNFDDEINKQLVALGESYTAYSNS